MKTTPRFTEFLRKQQSLLAVAVLTTISISPASAQLYWGSGGVTGAWTAAGNWYTDAAETLVSGAAPTISDNVVFNTTPDDGLGGTVTMAADIAANSITFNTTGATILSQSGNRVLTLGNGITVNSGAGNSTIGVSTNSLSVQVVAGQTWTNHSAAILNVRSLRASNTAAGPVAVTLNAASTGSVVFNLSIQDSPDAGKALSIVVDSAGTGATNLVTSAYTGGTLLKRGLLSTSGTLGSGAITVSEAAGTADTRLNVSGAVTNNIVVETGTGLRALTGNTGGDYQGNITLNRDVSLGTVAASGVTVTYSGDISGNAGITAGRVATGTSNPTLILTGDNTYTGKTTIESATVVVNSFNRVAGGTASSSLGAPTSVANGTIIMSSVSASTLRYAGTGETTDRVIELVNNLGATLEQTGSGILKLEGNVTMTGTGNRTLTLRGATAGSGEISGIIQNISGGTTGVTKTQTGTWKLSGLNEYSGVTSISDGGVLEVTKLTNGAADSSVGKSSNATGNLVFGGSSAATLKYVGSGDSTDRRFTVGGAGAIFDASGAGVINWANTGAPAYASTGQARTITFKGSNTGDNIMAATFADSGAGKTTIVKEGAGKWILTGNNTYTGNTTVTDGTLSITVDDLGDTSTVEIGAGAFLDLNRVSTDTVDAFYINGIQQAMGEWGSTTSDAPNKTARITGTGKLQVTTGPVASDPYLAWIDIFTSITVPADKEKAADPDHDGLTNAAEFALDGNPASGAATGRVRSQVETVGAEQALVITLPVRAGAVFDNTPGPAADATIDNLTYTIQGTNNLTVFDQGVTEISVSSGGMPALSGASWTYRTFRLNGPVGGVTPRGPNGFLRVMVVSAP